MLGSGLGQAGRVPLDVTAAGGTVVASSLTEVGRVPELRISLKRSGVPGVAGVTVPPLVVPRPHPDGIEHSLVVRFAWNHALADLVPVQDWTSTSPSGSMSPVSIK